MTSHSSAAPNGFLCDNREVVDIEDPLDRGYQPTGQAEVSVGDADDGGDCRQGMGHIG
jgi:hypothetical protein